MIILKWLNAAYCWLWYRCQWFVEPIFRRPWTYSLRDCGLKYPYIFWPIAAGFHYLSYWLGANVNYTGGFFFNAFLFLLQSHLWWGSMIVIGQQEDPPYLPDELYKMGIP